MLSSGHESRKKHSREVRRNGTAHGSGARFGLDPIPRSSRIPRKTLVAAHGSTGAWNFYRVPRNTRPLARPILDEGLALYWEVDPRDGFARFGDVSLRLLGHSPAARLISRAFWRERRSMMIATVQSPVVATRVRIALMVVLRVTAS